jgi:UDP-GlcNAc:undecaprenyl-phosphate GlcNAc-1-phosphate transferase
MKTYLSVYLGSALLAVLITPLVIRLARCLKAADTPDVRTVHKKPIPRIGGVAIFVSMICLIVPVLFLHSTIGQSFYGIQLKVIALLSAAAFVFVVGVIDDIKGLRARIKLLAQLAAAITVCAVGIRIKSVVVADWLTLDFGWFSWPLTIFWIVGITNAVNLTDGLDGLAAGISAIACGVIAVLAVYSGQQVMAVLMLAMLGSLTGFLFFNFNPAKIFMGDCGSLFLGFIIASSSVLCSTKLHALVGLALPVLALGIPIFDTLFSILRRIIERRSMFSPDRSHFHHRLLDLGLKQQHVVVLMYIVTLLATGLGMFMMATHSINTLVVFGCVLLLLLLVFRVVGAIRLRETIAGLKQKHAINHQMSEEIKSFEAVQLRFRRTATFDHWWQAVCLAADKMDFVSLSLPLSVRDGTKQVLTWKKNEEDSNPEELIKMTLPIRDRLNGPPLRLQVEISTNGSLESASRRITLFARLIEQHGIANLKAKLKQDYKTP